MVINPPLTCESCGADILGWEYNPDGTVTCTSCGHVNETLHYKKGRNGEELVSLIVASNSDTGTNSPNWHPVYNFLVNKIYTVSKNSLENDIRSGHTRVCSDEEAFNRKCMIVWTNTPGYVPGAPVPQWIKDMIRGN